MKAKVSMKDIAQRVGVSVALVSYALNQKEGRVGQEMTRKIRKAADDLHYRPNLIARSLRSGRTQTLGLILADISTPFFAHIARVIEDEALRHGYTVLFGSTDEDITKSRALIDTFLKRQVDGLIIAPAAGTQDQIQVLLKKKVPVVLIDRYFPGTPVSNVRIDNGEAARSAVEHLVRMGRRRIALVYSAADMEHVHQRERGYRSALEVNGIRWRKEWLLPISYNDPDGMLPRGLEKLLRQRPGIDGIFFATNTLAIAGLRHLRQMGVVVPEELAVVTFGQSEAFDLFNSPVTHVHQALGDMGREAIRLVLGHIEKKSRRPDEVVVGTNLIVRESSGRSIPDPVNAIP